MTRRACTTSTPAPAPTRARASPERCRTARSSRSLCSGRSRGGRHRPTSTCGSPTQAGQRSRRAPPTTSSPGSRGRSRSSETAARRSSSCVEISRVAGSATPFMKWIEFDNFGPTPVPEFDTESDTINPDAASAGGRSRSRRSRRRPRHTTPPRRSARAARQPGSSTPRARRSRRPPSATSPGSRGGRRGRARPCPGFATFFGTSAADPERRRDRRAAALREPDPPR